MGFSPIGIEHIFADQHNDDDKYGIDCERARYFSGKISAFVTGEANRRCAVFRFRSLSMSPPAVKALYRMIIVVTAIEK